MTAGLTPVRRRGVEYLDAPNVPAELLTRSMADVARANVLFGGTRAVLRELHRVARERVIISDLRRSWIAAAGIWLLSFPLRFHPVSRHDGVVSVLRGFTTRELLDHVKISTGATAIVRRHLGWRVTASWSPRS